MQIGVINGSHRDGATASLAVASMFVNMVKSDGHEPLRINLNQFAEFFPRWSADMWTEHSDLCQKWWKNYGQLLSCCDAIVLVVPEWNGDAPSAVKDFLDYATHAKSLKLKPVMLVGVSNEGGGASPVNTLRATGQKNNMFIVSPMHVYLRDIDVEKGWVPEDMDDALHTQCGDALYMLAELAHALKPLRHDEALMGMRSPT